MVYDDGVTEDFANIRLEGQDEAADGARSSSISNRLSLNAKNAAAEQSTLHLPDEIIVQILIHIQDQEDSQKTLASCCHLNLQWYNIAVPLLYEKPILQNKNFDPFVRTICPSLNLHVRKSPLSGLVRDLDMGFLISGSKSVTARLLSRTRPNLESFRAPQAAWAVNCLAALAKCEHLRVLDLSMVSESPLLPDLLKSIAHLEKLESLQLPRSAGFGSADGRKPVTWPPYLKTLVLSGGIDRFILNGDVAFPNQLKKLTIRHCPLAPSSLMLAFLSNTISTITTLRDVTISHMPRFEANGMDSLLAILPQIERLSISTDYITSDFFRPDQSIYAFSSKVEDIDWHQHKSLVTLELTNSGGAFADSKIEPSDVCDAIENGVLPGIRIVRVAKTLKWSSTARLAHTARLAELLQERATDNADAERDDSESGSSSSGIWFIKG